MVFIPEWCADYGSQDPVYARGEINLWQVRVSERLRGRREEDRLDQAGTGAVAGFVSERKAEREKGRRTLLSCIR